MTLAERVADFMADHPKGRATELIDALNVERVSMGAALEGIVRSCDIVLDRIGKGMTNPPLFHTLRAIRDDARRQQAGETK